MTTKTLFIGLEQERKFFPFARVDEMENGKYKFRYTKGLPGFKKCFNGNNPFHLSLPEEFPYLVSSKLIPQLETKIMNKKREDYDDYLDELGLLGKNPTDFEILAVSNGRSVTNNFEVFPLLEKDKDGKISCEFIVRFTHKIDANKYTDELLPGDKLYLEEEMIDGVEPALKVMTLKGKYHIGYTPRYISEDYYAGKDHKPNYELTVKKVSTQMCEPVLVNLTAGINGHVPMSSEEYQTYV